MGKAGADESDRSLELRIENLTQRPAPTIGAISILPQSARSVSTSTIQEQPPQQDSHDDDNDDYSSLPTVATAHAVSVAGGSSNNTRRSFAASTVNTATALDDERARFRQQVRDNLAAEAVQAVTQPNVPVEPNDLLDTRERRQIHPCRRNFLAVTMLFVAVVIAAVVVVAIVVATRRPSSASVAPAMVAPMAAVSSTDPPNSTTSPDIVLLPNGHQAFTTTEQLYQAVDDYDAALQANETAEGSLVAMQYGYPMGTWDVSRLTDFSKVFCVHREQTLEADVRLSALRTMNIPNLSGWSVSRATTMHGMFAAATNWLSDDDGLIDWDVGRVSDFSFMFGYAKAWTGHSIASWNTSSATLNAHEFNVCEGLQFQC